MASAQTVLSELLAEGAEIESTGELIQGETSLTATRNEIRSFRDKYMHWMAAALAVLPDDLRERFRSEYEGSWHSNKIKKFLEAPDETSPLFDRESSLPFSFWAYSFDSSFRGPLLAQRQILVEAQHRESVAPLADHLQYLEQIWRRLPLALALLARRYRDRTGLAISDEYDLQYLVRATLALLFDDVREEEWTPSYAGKASRMDFLLKNERVVVETKMTRQGLGDKDLGDELVQDIARYGSHPDCDALSVVVLDRERRVRNPKGFEGDLSGRKGEILVQVVVVQ